MTADALRARLARREVVVMPGVWDATSALVAHTWAVANSAGTLLRVRMNISCCAANRCCAMGEPMMPKPMKPIFMKFPCLN